MNRQQRLIKQLLPNVRTVDNRYVIPYGQKYARKIYDISEDEFRPIHTTKNEDLGISKLDSLGIEYSIEMLTWKKEVDMCDLEYKQECIVINKV